MSNPDPHQSDTDPQHSFTVYQHSVAVPGTDSFFSIPYLGPASREGLIRTRIQLFT